jgi:hypothetical protein
MGAHAQGPSEDGRLSAGPGARPEPRHRHRLTDRTKEVPSMNSIIYIVGLIVVVGAVLSFIGLH